MEIDWKLVAAVKAGEPEREKNGHFRFITKEETSRMLQLAADGRLRRAKKLVIANTATSDLSWISDCKKLEDLYVGVGSTKPVDLSGLTKLSVAELYSPFQKSAYGLGLEKPLELLTLRSPTPENLAHLGSGTKNLLVSGAPTEWPTFENSNNLERLKIVFCKKGPLNTTNISTLNNLRRLSINRISKGLVGCDALGSLPKLEDIFFWDVRPIDSLEWLKRLPQRINFGAWGSNDISYEMIEYLEANGLSGGISEVTRREALRRG